MERTAAYSAKPPVVVWECHHICDGSCHHERPEGHSVSREREFSTYEAHLLIQEIFTLSPERLIFGGDTQGRKDLYQLLDLSRRRGLRAWVSLRSGRDLTPAVIDHLVDSGAAGVLFHIDAATSELHDSISGVEGSFDLTLDAIVNARIKGLPVDVVTGVWRQNLSQIEPLAEMLEDLNVPRWTLYLPVPFSFEPLDLPTPRETEELFQLLSRIDESSSFSIELQEGRHFDRFRIQRWMKEKKRWIIEHFDPAVTESLEQLLALPANASAPETVFISHVGEVYLGMRMPYTGGNLHFESLETAYHSSPVFQMLRDRDLLRGKCGECEFRQICGGSRARAYAMRSDPMESDPLCIYQPGRLSEEWVAALLR
ncbi:MAG TPA: radical SAM protein [Thermoanaerobaculia bacterium]|nr:radical SAM protein [Thermoanaerobaculia bacterium]